GAQAGGQERAVAQGGQRGVAEVGYRQRFALVERAAGADGVQTAKQLAEAIQLVQIARLRRATATARKQRETKAAVFEQALAVPAQRRHHRHLRLGQLLGEGMLLADGRVAPALQAIELG